jgi:uncharacterized protein (DUF1499 family)
MKHKRGIVGFIIALLVLPILSLALLSMTGRRPTNLGVRDGKLAPCPTSPNCVSTQADDEQHRIAPIISSLSAEDSLRCLKQVLTEMPRVTIVTERPDYLHVEFRSALFRFVDDVEFFIALDEQTIHFRSASRVGHGDLGVNRSRMELIRKRFADLSATLH